jgi:hypothetical protein
MHKVLPIDVTQAGNMACTDANMKCSVEWTLARQETDMAPTNPQTALIKKQPQNQPPNKHGD